MPIRRYYFLYFVAAAALMPSLALLFTERGFSGTEVGVLVAVVPLTIALSGPTWGAIADRTGRGGELLGVGLAVSAVSGAVMVNLTVFAAALAMAVVFAIGLAPALPFGDAAALVERDRRGATYGALRAWGGVGWGVGGPLAGGAAALAGRAAYWVLHLVLTLALAVVGRRLVVPGGRFVGRTRDAITTLVRLPGWGVFLAAVFAFGFGSGIVSSFLFVRLADIGASALVLGLALSVGTVSELVTFRYSDRAVARVGAMVVLLIGIAALVVRMFLLGVLDSVGAILVLQLVHGLTFALPWTGAVTHALRTAPDELMASAQSAVGLTFGGFAPALGGLVGGLLLGAFGSAGMLVRTAAGLALAGLVILAVWLVRRSRGVGSGPSATEAPAVVA